jgi:hypothetical protein
VLVTVVVIALVLFGWSRYLNSDDAASSELAGFPSATAPTTVTRSPPTPRAESGSVLPTTEQEDPRPIVTDAPPTSPATTAPATTPTTSAPPATAPPATAPTTTPTTPPPTEPPPTEPPNPTGGELEIAGRAMSQPACDDSYITVFASALASEVSADGIVRLLDEHQGSQYLRTDQACDSLRPDVGGNAVYIVYAGPYPSVERACAERSRGPADAYVRALSNTLGPDHVVECVS